MDKLILLVGLLKDNWS